MSAIETLLLQRIDGLEARVAAMEPPKGFEQKKSILAIQQLCAFHFKLRLAELLSKRRTEHIAVSRMVAMMMCRESGYSLHEIGDAFNKDHGTVVHAVRSIHDKMDVDAALLGNVMFLRKKLDLPL